MAEEDELDARRRKLQLQDAEITLSASEQRALQFHPYLHAMLVALVEMARIPLIAQQKSGVKQALFTLDKENATRINMKTVLSANEAIETVAKSGPQTYHTPHYLARWINEVWKAIGAPIETVEASNLQESDDFAKRLKDSRVLLLQSLTSRDHQPFAIFVYYLDELAEYGKVMYRTVNGLLKPFAIGELPSLLKDTQVVSYYRDLSKLHHLELLNDATRYSLDPRSSLHERSLHESAMNLTRKKIEQNRKLQAESFRYMNAVWTLGKLIALSSAPSQTKSVYDAITTQRLASFARYLESKHGALTTVTRSRVTIIDLAKRIVSKVLGFNHIQLVETADLVKESNRISDPNTVRIRLTYSSKTRALDAALRLEPLEVSVALEEPEKVDEQPSFALPTWAEGFQDEEEESQQSPSQPSTPPSPPLQQKLGRDLYNLRYNHVSLSKTVDDEVFETVHVPLEVFAGDEDDVVVELQWSALSTECGGLGTGNRRDKRARQLFNVLLADMRELVNAFNPFVAHLFSSVDAVPPSKQKESEELHRYLSVESAVECLCEAWGSIDFSSDATAGRQLLKNTVVRWAARIFVPKYLEVIKALVVKSNREGTSIAEFGVRDGRVLYVLDGDKRGDEGHSRLASEYDPKLDFWFGVGDLAELQVKALQLKRHVPDSDTAHLSDYIEDHRESEQFLGQPAAKANVFVGDQQIFTKSHFDHVASTLFSSSFFSNSPFVWPIDVTSILTAVALSSDDSKKERYEVHYDLLKEMSTKDWVALLKKHGSMFLVKGPSTFAGSELSGRIEVIRTKGGKYTIASADRDDKDVPELSDKELQELLEHAHAAVVPRSRARKSSGKSEAQRKKDKIMARIARILQNKIPDSEIQELTETQLQEKLREHGIDQEVWTLYKESILRRFTTVKMAKRAASSSSSAEEEPEPKRSSSKFTVDATGSIVSIPNKQNRCYFTSTMVMLFGSKEDYWFNALRDVYTKWVSKPLRELKVEWNEVPGRSRAFCPHRQPPLTFKQYRVAIRALWNLAIAIRNPELFAEERRDAYSADKLCTAAMYALDDCLELHFDTDKGSYWTMLSPSEIYEALCNLIPGFKMKGRDGERVCMFDSVAQVNNLKFLSLVDLPPVIVFDFGRIQDPGVYPDVDAWLKSTEFVLPRNNAHYRLLGLSVPTQLSGGRRGAAQGHGVMHIISFYRFGDQWRVFNDLKEGGTAVQVENFENKVIHDAWAREIKWPQVVIFELTGLAEEAEDVSVGKVPTLDTQEGAKCFYDRSIINLFYTKTRENYREAERSYRDEGERETFNVTPMELLSLLEIVSKQEFPADIVVNKLSAEELIGVKDVLNDLNEEVYKKASVLYRTFDRACRTLNRAIRIMYDRNRVDIDESLSNVSGTATPIMMEVSGGDNDDDDEELLYRAMVDIAEEESMDVERSWSSDVRSLLRQQDSIVKQLVKRSNEVDDDETIAMHPFIVSSAQEKLNPVAIIKSMKAVLLQPEVQEAAQSDRLSVALVRGWANIPGALPFYGYVLQTIFGNASTLTTDERRWIIGTRRTREDFEQRVPDAPEGEIDAQHRARISTLQTFLQQKVIERNVAEVVPKTLLYVATEQGRMLPLLETRELTRSLIEVLDLFWLIYSGAVKRAVVPLEELSPQSLMWSLVRGDNASPEDFYQYGNTYAPVQGLMYPAIGRDRLPTLVSLPRDIPFDITKDLTLEDLEVRGGKLQYTGEESLDALVVIGTLHGIVYKDVQKYLEERNDTNRFTRSDIARIRRHSFYMQRNPISDFGSERGLTIVDCSRIGNLLRYVVFENDEEQVNAAFLHEKDYYALVSTQPIAQGEFIRISSALYSLHDNVQDKRHATTVLFDE